MFQFTQMYIELLDYNKWSHIQLNICLHSKTRNIYQEYSDFMLICYEGVNTSLLS